LSGKDFHNRIDSLLNHVDIIPEKLVMAQAILESGWGKSYLARKANNYFGMRCFRRGCGIPPYGVKSPDYWHRKYPTNNESVRDYMLNLNTGHAYREFRQLRHQQRLDNMEPDAYELANALTRYSELGADYIKMIKEVMKNYLPDDLPQFTEMLQINQQSAE
jgi:Bax protein